MSKHSASMGLWRAGLYSTAAMTLVFAATPTLAQPQPAIEEVLVTGSRIQRTDVTSPAPISVLSSEMFKEKGAVSIADVLQSIPQMAGSQTTGQTNNGGRGAASVNLRGLGSNRTLVLVNGRRMVSTDNLGTSLDVDINNIPQSIIDRVEVLRDGASAIYGSDAIGGVVNIITKTDFEGVAINGQAGITGERDGEEYAVDGTIGGKFAGDRGHAWLNISYYKTKPVFARDRAFSAQPKDAELLDDGTVDIFTFGSSFTPTGTAFLLDTGGAVVLNPDGKGGLPLSNANRFNYEDFQYLWAPQDRKSLAGQVEYGLWDSAVTAYMEGLYVKRQSTQQLAPPPLVVPNTTGFFVPADNQFNPFGEDVLLLRRLADFGAGRQYHQEADTYRLVMGFKGEVMERWHWDLSYVTGRNTMNANVFGLGRLDNINRGFLDPTCTPANGCTPVNLFGSNLSPAELDAIRFTEFTKQVVQQDVVEFNTTGNLFQLPAGAVGLAAGAVYRREAYRDDVDTITESGASSDGERTSSKGNYNVKEVYGEVSIPLIAGKEFAEYVGFDAAGRYSDYSTIGGVFSWKVGAQWAPSRDLRFRGVYSRAFRAPDVLELFAGRKINFPTFNDPCGHPGSATVTANCIAQGVANPATFEARDSQVNTVEEGNSHLKEERANTWTIGFVLTPRFVENLSITLDYYEIKLKNAIDVIDVQTILDQCLESTGLSSPLCLLIEPRDATGNLTRVVTQTSNVAEYKTRGIDGSVNYSHGLGDTGVLSLYLAGTYLMKLDKQPLQGLPFVKYAGFIGGLNINANPKWRANWSVSYALANLHLNYTGRLIGSAKSFTTRDNDLGASVRSKVPTYTYHDLQAGFQFREGLEMVVGVRNLFDKQPPFYFDFEDNNTDPSTYDMKGRFFYAAIRTKF